MENLRLLLAAIAALTLVSSIISSANPNYFVGLNAFADEHDEDDNSGSGSNDDDSDGKNDEEVNYAESLGESGKVTLTIDDDEVELEIEVEDGDLQDGQYAVLFACTDPEVDEEFAGALEVEEGDGEFETDLDLADGTYSGCEVSVGDLSASFPSFTVLAHVDDDEAEDEEHDEEDDDDRRRSDRAEREDEDKLVQSLGNHSKVSLQIDDEAELEVEIEDGDLDDGIFDIMFACDSPDIDEEFAGVLEVEDGEGEFEAELALSNGTYTGCEVDVGGLAATFSSFTILSDEDEEDDDERGEKQRERDEKRKDQRERSKVKLETDDDSVEIEVELRGLNMTDGSYDVAFSCEEPAFNVMFEDTFEVEDNEGKFKEEIGLANGTYSGCEIAIADTDMIIASFDPFTVQEGHEEEQEERVEEKRKERRDRIVSTVNGMDVHKRHRNANPASPGDYNPGWNYTLMASGSAAHSENDQANATTSIDMSLWKSNRAIILLDVTSGTVGIGNQTYTVVVGYSLYSIQHDAMRIVALAVNDDGNAVKLVLRGSAAEDEAGFPMESGSIDLTFAGSSGPSNNRLGDWQLTLEGTVEAG